MPLARILTAAGAAVLAAASLAPAAQAQQIYRIVGPDGRVTFSDKPPTDANAKAAPAPVVRLPSPGGASALPLELREPAGKYPVTLYTGPNCGPCGTGRALLAQRGIPFSERTVSTNEDIEALQRLAGDTSLPFLTIGAQQIKGFSDVEWSQFLDAAGYPRTSVLPPSYRQAAATPLVAVQRPSAAVAAEGARQASQAPEQPAVVNRRFGTTGQNQNAPAAGPAAPPSNPAGIRF